jgi:hypothetical protein
MPRIKVLSSEQMDNLEFDLKSKMSIKKLKLKYGVGPDRLNNIRKELGIPPRQVKTYKPIEQPAESKYFDVNRMAKMI